MLNVNELQRDRRLEWNKVAMALSSRAEELENATEAFADTVFVNTLKAKQNQIVYGRRGTGKTHLLKRLEEEYISKFDEYRSVPIFINGSKLRTQSNVIYEIPAAIALSVYIEFIKTLVDKLYEFINKRLDPNIWDQVTKGKQTQTAQKAKKITKELYELLQEGEVRFLPAGEASDEVQTLNETVAKVSGGLNLNLSDPRSLGWNVKFKAQHDKEAKKSGIILRKIKGQVILPFSQVATNIQELLRLMEGSSLVVLFDEWSDIDQRLDTQPYLADMIKRTLSSITQMHVKLACIPTRTLLATPITIENPIPIGYEEGDDISSDVDLDSIVFVDNDLKQFLPFFMNLLKRHIGMSLDWIRYMEMEEFERFICNEIFDGVDVFSELCQASTGVPRDFLHLFRNATTMQVSMNESKIKLLHIRKVAAKLHESKKKSFKSRSPELMILDDIYRNIIAKNKTYFFLLKEIHTIHPAIQMLWVERLIHKMPAVYYNIDNHTRYIYYQIDYGKIVDLLSSKAAKSGREKGVKMATAISEFSSIGWLGSIISTASKELLPTLMEQAEKIQRLADEPAGDLSPDHKRIMVDDSIFEVNNWSYKVQAYR